MSFLSFLIAVLLYLITTTLFIILCKFIFACIGLFFVFISESSEFGYFVYQLLNFIMYMYIFFDLCFVIKDFAIDICRDNRCYIVNTRDYNLRSGSLFERNPRWM